MADEKEELTASNETLDNSSADATVEASGTELNGPKLEVTTKEKKEKEKRNRIVQDKQEEKSRILEYLKNEHKWENFVLLFLSLFALVLGLLILNGTLTVNEDFPLIGNFPRAFAGTLVGLAVLAILLSLWPFFKPAFPEIKKISWPRGKAFLADTARVFIFLFILVGVFLLYDAFISKLIKVLLDL